MEAIGVEGGRRAETAEENCKFLKQKGCFTLYCVSMSVVYCLTACTTLVVSHVDSTYRNCDNCDSVLGGIRKGFGLFPGNIGQNDWQVYLNMNEGI